MKLNITVLLLFALSTVFTQNATFSSKKESKKSQRVVKVNLEKDQKLKLVVKNETFDMSVTFPYSELSEVEDLFETYYNSTKSNKREWQNALKSASVELKKNKVCVKMDKTKISSDERKKLEQFTNELLTQLDWDVEEMGLWQYEGDWSLSKK